MMVAVTINTDGEVHATELGQPVAAFGDPTKKYVQLEESLGSVSRKCGIDMSTRGRVGRAYFRTAFRVNAHSRLHDRCVSKIEWIDVKDTDTVGITFKNIVVKDRESWCLVLDPQQLIPDYALLDFEWLGNEIRCRNSFVNSVNMNGKHTYYIQQIELLLILLRRIAAVEMTDRRRLDWTALYDALKPLRNYYDNYKDTGARHLHVQNPDAEDNRHFMASRITPRSIDAYEESIRLKFDRFWEDIAKYLDACQNDVNRHFEEWDYNNLLFCIYDVPVRGKVYTEAPADPQGLLDLFQKQIPDFNNAMFIAALITKIDPTRTILYYEHMLQVLRSGKPSDETDKRRSLKRSFDSVDAWLE